MSRWRIGVVAGLWLFPVIAWAGLGWYFLFTRGLAFWVWWPLVAMMALGTFLAWKWQREKKLLQPVSFDASPAWTSRDQEAFRLVEARAKVWITEQPDKLGQPPFLLQAGRELAEELARFYHPGNQEVLDAVTLPELLSVVELVTHDLRGLEDTYLPGGHLLTIGNWRQAGKIPGYYRTASNAYWVLAMVFNPVETAFRYVASQAGLGAPLKMLQDNLYQWFFTAYMQRLGSYLIDLNGGRLRPGLERYREWRDAQMGKSGTFSSPLESQALGPLPPSASQEASEFADIQQITITVLGQVKAGKSSLINAFLGENRARTGVIRTTEGIQRFELVHPDIPTRLIIHDTVGYGHTGAKIDQVDQTAELVLQSDLVLLVMHANNPARKADVDFLEQIRRRFEGKPERKPPVILAVLTHVDLISPSMEWSPPYEVAHGSRPKEVSIRESLQAAREQLEGRIVSL
ncbi:MAG: GTPase family protein, partial [Gemmataceae bacterium]